MIKTSRFREAWIDSLRGFGIVCVVLGHTVSGALHDFIYMFHMPLFFFISGWVFKLNANQSVLEALISRVLRLMYPLFIAILFVVLVPEFVAYLWGSGTCGFSICLVLSDFHNEFYGTVTSAMWFLPALLLVEVTMLFALNISNQWVVLLFFFLLSFIFFLVPQFAKVPRIIFGAGVCGVYFALAVSFRSLFEKKLSESVNLLGLLLLVICIGFYYFFPVNSFDVAAKKLGGSVRTPLLSCLLVISFFLIFFKNNFFKLFSKIGILSLIIYLYHQAVNALYFVFWDANFGIYRFVTVFVIAFFFALLVRRIKLIRFLVVDFGGVMADFCVRFYLRAMPPTSATKGLD